MILGTEIKRKLTRTRDGHPRRGLLRNCWLAGVVLGVSDAFAFDIVNSMFVVSSKSANVEIVDMRNDKPSGGFVLPAYADMAALSEQERKLVTANRSAKALVVTPVDNLSATAIIGLDFAPEKMLLDGNGRMLAVGNAERGVIQLFDLRDNRKLRRFAGLNAPAFFIFDKDGEVLFVVDRDATTLSVLDLKEGRTTQKIPLRTDGNPASDSVQGLLKTPGGRYGFVMHGKSGYMSVVDLHARKLISNVMLEGPALKAYPTANSQYLIMPNGEDATISLLSTWSLSEIARLQGLHDVKSVTIALLDKVAVVVSGAQRRAIAFDVDTRRLLASFRLDGVPVDSAISPDGTKVYVALQDSGIAVIDIMSLRITQTISGVGGHPVNLVTARASSYCH